MNKGSEYTDMDHERMACRQIDRNEECNWLGTERKHIARFHLKSKTNKYSTHDMIQINDNVVEIVDTGALNGLADVKSGVNTVIGGSVIQHSHELQSWKETYLLNSNKRNSSKERYNLDYNRNLIGKIHTCYYVKNNRWNRVYGIEASFTSIVIQYKGTNNYSVFNTYHQTFQLAKNMTGVKKLYPSDCVVVDCNGDILEKLSSRHIGAGYSYDWRFEMEKSFRSWEGSGAEKSKRLFPWCYEGIEANKKLFEKLSVQTITVTSTQSLSLKKRLKRAHLGLQLLLCELNARMLYELVCPAPRALDILLQGTVFGRGVPGAAINKTANKTGGHSDDSMAELTKAIWMDMAHETTMQCLPKDMLELVYAFNVVKPLSFVFKELLYRENKDYGAVVKGVRDVGALKGREYLVEHCLKYLNDWLVNKSVVQCE